MFFQLIKQYKDHSFQVRSVDFSSNNSIFATGGRDSLIKVRHIEKEEPLYTFKVDDYVNGVRFHPKFESILATGSGDRVLRYWDVNLGNLLYEIELPEAIGYIEFSKDGNNLGVVVNNKVFIYDASKLTLKTKLEFPKRVNCIEFNYNHTLIAVAYGHIMDFYNVKSGERVYGFQNKYDNKTIEAIAWHPTIDESTITSGLDVIVLKENPIVLDASRRGQRIEYSSDGNYLFYSSWKSISIANHINGEIIQKIEVDIDFDGAEFAVSQNNKYLICVNPSSNKNFDTYIFENTYKK